MRDHFIPIRKQDLVALLSNELEAGDCTDFEKLCHIVESVFHHDYHQQLESLKSDYAAFDPDADTRPTRNYTEAQREQAMPSLFEQEAANC